MPRVRVPEAASGLARVAAGSMVRRGCAGSGRAVATVAAPRALEVAEAAAGVPGAEGSGRRGHRGHGQGPAERPRAASAVRKQERLHWWREGRREAAREGQGEGGGGGRLRGAGGAWGRGRKLLEQQPRATSITFNFKSERGSWKSTGVAIWQRHGKRRLRGPGSAAEHLWTRRGRRENGSPGRGGAEEALRAQRDPSEGRLSRGEVGALRLRVWRWKVRRPRDHPAPRPPSPPPGADSRAGRVSAARGRARSAPPGGRASRLPRASAPGARAQARPRGSSLLALRGRSLEGFRLRTLSPSSRAPPLVSLLSFLSFQ